MRKQKNKKLSIIIGLVVLVALVILCVWGMQKTSWDTCAGGDSYYNDEMELEGVYQSGSTDELDKNKEYRVEDKGDVSQGELTVAVYCNEQLLYQKTYTAGNYEIEPLEISGEDGELKIWYTWTEGTAGESHHTMYVRCRNWYSLYQRIYNNFFAKDDI